jgi:hypothetical protein
MVATVGGGAGSSEAARAWKPEPGAAVGVRLLGGDATLTGIGTITYVDGDRILAFGHPMFQAGTVDMPLVSAEVHTLVPSTYISFKLGSPIGDVGALVQDRRPGVAGLLDSRAPTVPIRVAVDLPGYERADYRYEALRDKRLTPVLASWAVSNSFLDRGPSTGETTVRFRMNVDLEGADDLAVENVYASGSVLGDVTEGVLFPLQVLANNNIARPEVNGVDVSLVAEDGRRAVRIERIRIERGEVRPGEEVRGAVTFRHYQGETEERPVALSLPDDVPEGRLLLRVCDAPSSEDWDSKRAPNRFAAKTIDDLVRILEELRTNDAAYIQLFSSAEGVTVNGREMPRLPASRLAVIGGSLHDGDGAFIKGAVVAADTLRTDAYVTGCKSLNVDVNRTAP